jgi:uncharacterized protein (TIGR00290 family)
MKKRTLLSWSSGKDSAWALHTLRQGDDFEVVGLVTTINEEFDRVAMHAVRETLLCTQASAVNLPLHKIQLPYPCSNEEYEYRMQQFIDSMQQDGIEYMAFGDLYLEDIRQYREQQLVGTGIEPVFPLWQIPTDQLASEMIHGGLKARISCVDPKQLDKSFAGRDYDASFLADLPEDVDPCGENGEFHSFAYAGPMFVHDIEVRCGVTTQHDGFIFTDLLADTPNLGLE